ncbi:MAG: cation transporter [Nanoarchaeota archaeon]|nr:cation transporter [Nanoarchaeota archaeon]
MTIITIDTKGMHCTSCEMLVRESLEEIYGVRKAEASHKTGKIKVNYDEKKASRSKIDEVIKKEGYKIIA